MTVPNFHIMLKNALQGDHAVLQQWEKYCQDNTFSDQQRKLAKHRIHQIISNHLESTTNQANAFFLRGILCELEKLPFTAKHCYQYAAALEHPSASSKVLDLTQKLDSQTKLPVDLSFKSQILRPFQQYLQSRTSWWGKLLTRLFRNTSLTAWKVQHTKNIYDEINYYYAGSYTDLSAYLQLAADVHIGACHQYQHAYHANVNQSSLTKKQAIYLDRLAQGDTEEQAQRIVDNTKIQRHYRWFMKSNLAQCLNKSITIAERKNQQENSAFGMP